MRLDIDKITAIFRRIPKYFFSSHALVVAGLGRCGTSLISNTLRNSGYIPGPFIVHLDDKLRLRPGYIHKTHSYPPYYLQKNIKLIFMFGNPMDIALSTYKRINAWGEMHHLHLQSDLFEPNDSILFRDTLKLDSLFKAWYKEQNFGFISIRYETLYTDATQKLLKEYLGFRLPLPPYKKRKSNWEVHPKKNSLYSVYGQLNDSIESADDVRIWN